MPCLVCNMDPVYTDDVCRNCYRKGFKRKCDFCGKMCNQFRYLINASTRLERFICQQCVSQKSNSGCIPTDYPDDGQYRYWGFYLDLFKHPNGKWYSYKFKPIKSYHASHITKVENSLSDNLCGFELEVVPTVNRDDLAYKISEIKDFYCEEDSSLDEGGFEIISGYGDLDKILHMSDKLSEVLQGKAESHNTSCCGLHVHLSKRDTLSNAKMNVFWNDPDNKIFLKPFARRWGVRFSNVDPSKNKQRYSENDIDHLIDNPDKYRIINIQDHTLEVRAFRGTTNPKTLKSCIELSWFSYEYCSNPLTSDQLHWESFLNWLPNESKFIKPYALSKGILPCA